MVKDNLLFIIYTLMVTKIVSCNILNWNFILQEHMCNVEIRLISGIKRLNIHNFQSTILLLKNRNTVTCRCLIRVCWTTELYLETVVFRSMWHAFHGHGLKLTLAPLAESLQWSSDSWDCHYRSSHRRPFAVPVGVGQWSLQTTIVTPSTRFVYVQGFFWKTIKKLALRSRKITWKHCFINIFLLFSNH